MQFKKHNTAQTQWPPFTGSFQRFWTWLFLYKSDRTKANNAEQTQKILIGINQKNESCLPGKMVSWKWWSLFTSGNRTLQVSTARIRHYFSIVWSRAVCSSVQHKQIKPARPPAKMYFLVQDLNANSTTGIRDLLSKGVKSGKIAFLHSFHKSPKAKNCLQTTQLDFCPTAVVYNKLCQTTDTEGKTQWEGPKTKGSKRGGEKKKR